MPVVQYIGSDPTWGPQQQVARRHAVEQTSVTLGDLSQSDSNIRDRSRDAANNPYQLRWRDSTYAIIQAATQWALNRLDTTVLGVADYDPTVRGVLKGGDPYQLRWRDSTTSNISGATQEWVRKRFSTNELGVADYDPTVKPRYQDPHQRRHLDPGLAVQPTLAWLRLRLNTNDLGDVNADATVKAPWAESEAYLWPAPRQAAAITGTNAWRLTRLTSNDLGTADADPTIVAPWEYSHPYTLYKRDPTVSAIEAYKQWALNRLSIDLEVGDADPTVLQPWLYEHPFSLYRRDSTYSGIQAWYAQLRLWEASTPVDAPIPDADPTVTRPPYQDPHQRRHGDPAWYVQPTLAWLRKRLSTNELGLADQDTTIRPTWQMANPYTLRLGYSAIPAIEAWYAQLHLWEASTPTDVGIPDADPTLVRREFVEPYQLRWRPSWPTQRRPWPTPLEEADPTVRLPWQYANPWHLRTRPSWPTQRLYYPQPGVAPSILPDPTPYLTFHKLDGRRVYVFDGTTWHLLDGTRDYDLEGRAHFILDGRRTYRRRP